MKEIYAFTMIEDEEKPKIMNTDNIPTKQPKVEIVKEVVVEDPEPGLFTTMMDFSNLNGTSLVAPAPVEKKTRKKRNTDITTVDNSSSELTMLQSNIPYETKYEETTNALKSAVLQIDVGLNDLTKDLSIVRGSKTMAKKWEYIPALSSTYGSLINTKVSALREINNTISKCQDLELKRHKELKLVEGAQNDTKSIMDTYNAFISMPTGGTSPLPTMNSITTSMPGGINVAENEAGYQNYLNNLNPSQILAMHETDPNVKQVIVYDESTGSRYFEVMNVVTGDIIPGADKHDAMFLEDTELDLNNMIARNINLNEVYPIIKVGNKASSVY